MAKSKLQFGIVVVRFFENHHLHKDISLCADGVVSIKRYDVRSDEAENQSLFDMNRFWLPENDIYPQPTSLLLRDDLVCALLLFLDDFICRTRSSKSRHDRARVQMKICIKFFEYFWIRGFFRLVDVPKSITEELAKELASIGWVGALRIDKRINALISDYEKNKTKNLTGILSRSELRSWLVTNIEASNLTRVYRYFKGVIAGGASVNIDMPSIGFSSLRQVLDGINRLYGLRDNCGLAFFPYENTLRLASKLVGRGGRTSNISPADAAILFSGSFEIVLNLADDVVSLIKSVSDLVIKAHELGEAELGGGITEIVSKSIVPIKFKSKIGVDIIARDKADDVGSIRSCVLLVIAACFVILAGCNARRRDEIQHKKYGLYNGCASIVDEQLGLYVSEFYIEKTLLDYSVFYINSISYRCINILAAFQDQFDRVDFALGRSKTNTIKRERSLFSYRRFNKVGGVGVNKCWFGFNDSRRGYIKDFLNYVFPDGHNINVAAHMFRRLYGLLFMYRHEMPEVQALTYQYMHDSFSSTVTYITDPEVKSDLSSLDRLYGVNSTVRRKAYEQHCQDVEDELLAISKERLKELVSYTLAGGKGQGGFTRFLKSVFRRYMQLVEFKKLSFTDQTEVVSDRFLSRGHLPNPFRHSICVASSTKHSALAHCASKDGSMVRPELASPGICHGCPFQYLNEHHINNMISDRKFLLDELKTFAEESLSWKASKWQLHNLDKIIEYHLVRMSK